MYGLLLLYGDNVCMFWFKAFQLVMCIFMGLVAWIDNVMVASSSPIGGSGTLQEWWLSEKIPFPELAP